MADKEMDSWDEEEKKKKDEEEERQRFERSYRSHQRCRAYRDLKRYRDGYPDRQTDSTPQENSLYKKLFTGATWLLMWVPGSSFWLVMVKPLREFLASVYRRLSLESTQIQRACVPVKGEDVSEMWNLEFYLNKKRYKPHGDLIEVILHQWKDNYVVLEQNHSYIQWLFPLREQGMNSKAKMLTPNEIKMMKKEKEVMRRFVEAYKLMLGFYGIRLVDEDTGEVERVPSFEKRFENLDYHSHNNLRITRILKCLGELGFERYQAPLVRFFLKETLVEKRLPNVKNSVLDYFMFTVKDKEERRNLVHFAWENYEPKEKFIWGPIEKLKKYKKTETENKSDVHIVNEKVREDMDNHSNGNGKDEEQGNKPNGKNAVMGDQDDSTRGHPSAVGRSNSEDTGKVSNSEQEEGNESNDKSTDSEIDGGTRSIDGDDNEKGIHIQETESGKPSGNVKDGHGAGGEDVQSPRRPGEKKESEASSSSEVIEIHEGSPDDAGTGKCRNEGAEAPKNDGKAESDGGSDVDNKTQSNDPRKRKMDINDGDHPLISGSTSYKELPDTLDQRCKNKAQHAETEPKILAEKAKKPKRENDPSGDGGIGGSVADGGLQESQMNQVAIGSQDKMNVDQDQLPDKDGRKCSSLDETNGDLSVDRLSVSEG